MNDDIRYVLTWSGGGFTITRMTSYTITGLTVGTTYTITVSAHNRCGGGPEFTTSILFSPDTTSTTTIISPTVTTSTNPMTIVSTVIPTTTTTITNIVVSTTHTTNISTSVDVTSKFSCSSVTYNYVVDKESISK